METELKESKQRRAAADAGSRVPEPAAQQPRRIPRSHAPKKAHASPVLTRWGTLRGMTLKVGKTGKAGEPDEDALGTDSGNPEIDGTRVPVR
jgi:hypothetical protein